MEYYNDILCINYDELVNNVITYHQFKWYQRCNKIQPVRRACRGNYALYSVESLPEKFKDEVKQKCDIPARQAESKETANDLLSHIRIDDAALKFYKDYVHRNGREIDPAVQVKYANSAAILNAIAELIRIHKNARARQRAGRLSNRVLFERFAAALPRVSEMWDNTLPEYPRNLEIKYRNYLKEGYASLIKQTCTDYKHAQLVTPYIERVLLSIYVMKNKPFAKSVNEIYSMFLRGEIEVVDKQAGELFDRYKCYKNDMPATLSESTVWNVLNKPKNRRIADSLRNDMMYNKKVHEPYQERETAYYSLSKISMDDRDLTRKTPAGESVKAYYAYDVASGCVIAAAYSLKKDIDLVWDCFRDLYRFLERNGLNNPIELEVEHHLMNTIEPQLREMFPYVTFCNPANSRQKRAEHFNFVKKYGAEKELGQTNGRWWSKHEAFLAPQKREGAEYVEPKLAYNRLVAEDREANAYYNNMPHPNQENYPGMTRLQVLLQKRNENAPEINKPVWFKNMGFKTETSLRNSKYMTVQYAKYCLPDPELVDRFKPNNYGCEAYWLANEDGTIDSIYVWQSSQFIGKCKKVTKYQEAIAEQTEADRRAIVEQCKYDAKYHRMLREGKAEKIVPVEILKTSRIQELEQIKDVATAPPVRDEIDDIIAAAYADRYSEDEIKRLAINSM
jgi:hypothetical protein